MLIDDVHDIVAGIPAGKVMTYGGVGDVLGIGPRQAGRLVAALDDDAPWWRVAYADGTPAFCHGGIAPGLLRDEGVPFRRNRIDLDQARADDAQ